jgi:thioesterase domain-containing protein
VVQFARLARLLNQQPFYGFQAYSPEGGQLPGTTIEGIAARYITAMKQAQPTGPYRLGGFSYGGTIAFEMARQLQAQGETLALLAMLDTPAPVAGPLRARITSVYLKGTMRRLPHVWRQFWRQDASTAQKNSGRLPRLGSAARELKKSQSYALQDVIPDAQQFPEERRDLMQALLDALQKYVPLPYPGRVTLFSTRDLGGRFAAQDPHRGWDALALGGVELRRIPGRHDNLFKEPHVRDLAAALSQALDRAS